MDSATFSVVSFLLTLPNSVIGSCACFEASVLIPNLVAIAEVGN
jgi:hypothetical protein